MKIIRYIVLALALCQQSLAMAQEDRMALIVPPEVQVVKNEDLPAFNVSDKIHVKNFAGDAVLVAQTTLKKGAQTPHHNHPEEEFMIIVSGNVRVHSGDFVKDAGVGDIIVVPPYVPHYMEALEDSFVIESFGPGSVIRFLGN